MRIGLDFGTTNSGAALFDGRRVHVFPLDLKSQNPQVMRSTLYITRQHELFFGREAIDAYYEQNRGRPSDQAHGTASQRQELHVLPHTSHQHHQSVPDEKSDSDGDRHELPGRERPISGHDQGAGQSCCHGKESHSRETREGHDQLEEMNGSSITENVGSSQSFEGTRRNCHRHRSEAEST